MDNLKIELKQWLKMVNDNDAITGIYRAIVCDGKNIGSISVEKKDGDAEIGYMLLNGYELVCIVSDKKVE